jgi:hypothetical protein
MTYLETFNAVREQKRNDYRRASAGEITWREYARKWGVL